MTVTFDDILAAKDRIAGQVDRTPVRYSRKLSLLTGASLEYEVRLTLKAEDVTGVDLSSGARLGWDSYLCSRAETRARSDTCYTLHALQ